MSAAALRLARWWAGRPLSALDLLLLRAYWRAFRVGFLAALAVGAAALILLALATSAAQAVTVSWYLPTGRVTASGVYPYPGSAGCSYDFALGSLLAFEDGRRVVCLDRGALGSGGHVDIFVRSRAEGQAVAASYPGNRASVEVERWGW